jgi:hypothetical protein
MGIKHSDGILDSTYWHFWQVLQLESGNSPLCGPAQSSSLAFLHLDKFTPNNNANASVTACYQLCYLFVYHSHLKTHNNLWNGLYSTCYILKKKKSNLRNCSSSRSSLAGMQTGAWFQRLCSFPTASNWRTTWHVSFPIIKSNILIFQIFISCLLHSKNESWKHPPWIF